MGDVAASRRWADWAVPLAAGTALTAVAAEAGNPIVPVGTAEVAAALLLGALLRSAPFRIGLLLVVPPVVYLVVAKPESWRSPLLTLAVFAAFALFDGLAAGAGAMWANDVGEWRRNRARRQR